MTNRKLTAAAVALQSVALAPHALATVGEEPPQPPETEELHEEFLSSFEGSWLELPHHCKARFFNADAVKTRIKVLEAHIEELYSALEENQEGEEL